MSAQEAPNVAPTNDGECMEVSMELQAHEQRVNAHDDWIEHDGSSRCPVPADVQAFMVRFRDGTEEFYDKRAPGLKAIFLPWGNLPDHPRMDITHWRPAREKENGRRGNAPITASDPLGQRIGIVLHENFRSFTQDSFVEHIEHIDRENARLRRELAEAKQRARTAEQRLRGITFHVNDAGDLIRIDERDRDGKVVRVMWEKREHWHDGVIRVEPFPEVSSQDSDWPPPAHRARVLP